MKPKDTGKLVMGSGLRTSLSGTWCSRMAVALAQTQLHNLCSRKALIYLTPAWNNNTLLLSGNGWCIGLGWVSEWGCITPSVCVNCTNFPTLGFTWSVIISWILPTHAAILKVC